MASSFDKGFSLDELQSSSTLLACSNAPLALPVDGPDKPIGKYRQIARRGICQAGFGLPLDRKCDGGEYRSTAVTITWPDDRRPSLARVVSSDLDFRISSKNLVGYFGRPFVKVPTISALMKMSNDGIVKSLTGERVEPDGYGNDGSPSWLLVLGYI